ncbi:MAG: hypothetical protein LH475_12450 [Cryobacterium sp.]|uniref:hypothetical protein n=1 Tax=unclassified Cryobacterium TaxID=2649013 RepID=UPI0018CB7CEF|nr:MULTISPECIES: hypothetical protein [unclassified Cryobacterium]MCY7405417.1 hypothetical protein [Cryobacterium sp.]MEC5152921.1 hypothetical protein [Cryobacterium sp. CAN_C3]
MTTQGAAFGVGVQVIVHLDRTRFPQSLIDDPIGVIVAAGESEGAGLYAPTAVRQKFWIVRFEEPFLGLDGSGPHDSARIPQSFLEAAPEA